MVVSIHQPDYLPYLGYFYKMYSADTFIFLDNVQFSSGNMHNWNNILTGSAVTRLKIPVAYRFGDNLTQVACKYELGWVEKHLRLIREAYSGAPFFDEVYPVLEDLIGREYDSLADLNICLNTEIARRLGITCKIVKASDIPCEGKKESLVINLCRAVGGDCYISGLGAKNYQDEQDFAEQGVVLKYSDFSPFPYKQMTEDFVPNMSVVDYVMNCGWRNPYVGKKGTDGTDPDGSSR